MLTFNKILATWDQWSDIGPSYDDDSILVYSGDLWALAKAFSGKPTDTKTLNRLQDIAEHYGVELRFYDETITDDNGKVHNTSPTCWGWTPTYTIHDCQVWAVDEAQDSDHCESYAEYLIDNDNIADQFDVDFTPIGFKRWESLCESGFHHGQNDTPESLRESIEAIHGPCELIFYIDSTGQFDVTFGAWFKPENMEG